MFQHTLPHKYFGYEVGTATVLPESLSDTTSSSAFRVWRILFSIQRCAWRHAWLACTSALLALSELYHCCLTLRVLHAQLGEVRVLLCRDIDAVVLTLRMPPKSGPQIRVCFLSWSAPSFVSVREDGFYSFFRSIKPAFV